MVDFFDKINEQIWDLSHYVANLCRKFDMKTEFCDYLDNQLKVHAKNDTNIRRVEQLKNQCLGHRF